MEKITKKKTKLSSEKNNLIEENPKMSQTDFEQLERMKVIGWENAMECANALWGSIHSSLLQGNLVFAYKNTKSDTNGFGQLVVVQNPNCPSDFGIGAMYSGYTMLLPHIPLANLEEMVLDDFKKYKVESKIQNIFKAIIERYKINQ